MDLKYTIFMVALVGSSVVLAILNLLYAYLHSFAKLLYPNVFVMVGIFFFAVMTVLEWAKREKGLKLGEKLFLSKFGVKPDKTKILLAFTYKYDHLHYNISTKSLQIKFWSQGQVYKGIVDIENERLLIKEPVLLTVHTGDVIPVWKDVTKVHRNGKPKAVVFRDDAEQLRGIDYLDEEGILKRGSLRRYKSIEVYWFPEKEVWEP